MQCWMKTGEYAVVFVAVLAAAPYVAAALFASAATPSAVAAAAATALPLLLRLRMPNKEQRLLLRKNRRNKSHLRCRMTALKNKTVQLASLG